MAPVTQQRRFGCGQFWPWLGAWLLLGFGCIGFGAELEEARRLFLAGQYNACADQAEKAVAARPEDEAWQLLLSKALLATGKYREACSAMTNALARDPKSLALRWQARDVFQSNGDTETANQMVEEVIQRGTGRAWMYRDDAASLVAIGQALLLRGIDPKSVLDAVFANARKMDPKLRELYLASGQLALDKHDFALAAKKFEEGLKQLPNDPELQYGLAQAYAPSAPAIMLGALESALEKNSNHVGCLLLMVDHSIDAEDYGEAQDQLERINVINSWQPQAWAYRAVLAHLKNQAPAEERARANALKFWPDNPQVDYLIGKKLSQNYRFAEGAAHQRQALQYDPDYLPAKAQLAEDLLRLGQEAEGWKLAQEVQKKDGYDVQAYNLVGLHEKMSVFATLTNSDFLVRMTRHEASVYGQRVLQLLGQARSNLCAKYGVELQRPTIVEIFADQKDFAVRTFGMPGNPGYLGVCFGRVVTANSPASQAGHPVNWQAVLWHEFCHVVTLQLTANKMPRWLSEGISVYEEIQANPSWGQSMNPQYREMVLGDDLTPLSELSAAFLSPRSDLHLQFAYFEASLVVEFLVQRFGLDSLKAVLRDLGQGVEIHQALESHTAAMTKLDEEFSAFARERANELAPGLDFEKPAFARQESGKGKGKGQERPQRLGPVPASGGGESWSAWAKEHPTNFWALALRGQELVEEKKWAEAKPVLQRLLELFPNFAGPDSAYRLLAAAHRALGETNLEKQVLSRFAALDKEATDAYLRLMELNTATQEWPEVSQNAQWYLAVNPLVAPPYRHLAQASEAAGDLPSAALAYRALLELDPSDPAEAHFQLASILHRLGDPAARRQVLQALEEAPRYRAALQLLLEIERASPQTKLDQAPATAQASP